MSARTIVAAFLMVAVQPGTVAAANGDADGPEPARGHLRSAIAAYDHNDNERAGREIQATIDDPAFPSLESGSQHTALVLAAQLAFAAKDAGRAQYFLHRATAMAEQTLDDWRSRFRAAELMEDARDEAACIVGIARRFGHDASNLPLDSVRRAASAVSAPGLEEARFELLGALYDVGWRGAESGSDEWMWREYARMLLERNELDRAVQVASRIHNPYQLIAMRADRRFRPLLRSPYAKADARKGAAYELEAVRAAAGRQPRSLESVRQLAAALSARRQEAEALTVARAAEQRLAAAAATGVNAYDDGSARLPYLLDVEARTLVRLGRLDEALATARRAAELASPSDRLTLVVALGRLLSDLGEATEALRVLPKADASELNPTGRARVLAARLTAEVELGHRDEVERALAGLRALHDRFPATLQSALLRAGIEDEAEEVLLWRLREPTYRSDALLEMQEFGEESRPPRLAEWERRRRALLERPRIRAAVAEVGSVDRYPWLNSY